MSVNASWLNPGDSDQRRVRQLSRQRERRVANLSLVPTIEPVPSIAARIPLVVPADYETDHAITAEPRRAIEIALLLATAIACHLAVVWWAAQPAAQPKVIPPQIPIEVILTKPPVVLPIVQPTPPKPTPVKKLTAAVPKPAPRVETPLTADAITIPPPPQASPAPLAPVSEKVTEARADADYLQNPAPNYPGLAQRQGWEGTVWLHVLVKPDGTPGQIDLEKSSGRKTLDDAALTAVKNWRFVPAKRGDTPVEGWVSVPIEFKLGK